MGEETPITPPAGGEGQPDGTSAPAEGEFQMPEKFKGKSAEDVVKSYQELEKELGKKNQTPAEIAEIKSSLNELRQAIEAKDKGKGDEGEGEGEDLVKKQKDYLRSMGVTFKEDVDRIKDEAKKEYELDRTFETLEKEFDGKDGRPKFDRKEIADFAIKNGYDSLSPTDVYKLKHDKELIDWHIKKAQKGNGAPIVPEGGRRATPPGGDGKELSKMTDEERRTHLISKINAQG